MHPDTVNNECIAIVVHIASRVGMWCPLSLPPAYALCLSGVLSSRCCTVRSLTRPSLSCPHTTATASHRAVGGFRLQLPHELTLALPVCEQCSARPVQLQHLVE